MNWIGAALLGLALMGFLGYWYLSQGQEWKSLTLGGKRIAAMGWVNGGESLIVTAETKIFRVGFPDFQIQKSETLEAEATGLVVMPQGVLLGLNKGQIQWRDLDQFALKKSWNDPTGGVKSMALSPDGNRFALGGEKGLVIGSLAEPSLGPLIKPVSRTIEHLAWRDATTLVFTCGDSRLHWLDPGEGEARESKKGGVALESLGLFWGQRVVTGNKNGGMALWNAGLDQSEKAVEATSAALAEICGDPSGRWVVGGGKDGRVYFWDVQGENRAVARRGHQGKILEMLFHPREPFVVTGGSDGTLKIWKPPA